MAESPQLLHHISLNPTSSPTLLFTHGAFGSGADWDLVVPHLLSTYHILLSDLPGHGDSTSTHPIFSSSLCVSTLASLIGSKAQKGKAHIIGLSLGAHIAISLACEYPDLCLSVLVSGFQVFEPGSVLGKYMPTALYLQSRLESLVPKSFMKSLMSGADIQPSYPSLELCRQIGGSMGTFPEAPWPARTLVVAAGKGGILPTADRPEDARKLAGIVGNGETVAVTHKGIRHPWNRQEPRLFAELVVAWVEGNELPEGFVRL